MFKNYILLFANMVTLGRGGGGSAPDRFHAFYSKKPLHANLWLFLNFSCGGPHEKKSNILFYPPPLRGIFGHPVHPNFVFFCILLKKSSNDPPMKFCEKMYFLDAVAPVNKISLKMFQPPGGIFTPPPPGGGG